MVELAETQFVLLVDRLQCFGDQVGTQLQFFVAALHRQLQVEDGVLAQSLCDPARDEGGDAARLFDHVAHQPVDRLARHETETIFLLVSHLAGFEQFGLHRPVVDCGDLEMARHQVPGPAARCGTEVDGAHAGLDQSFLFVFGQQAVKRLGQLERRARRRFARHAQARNAARPLAAPAGPGQRHRGAVGRGEKDVQARSLAVVAEGAGRFERLTHEALQLAAEA